ncbi:MAG: hypothetical protein WB524_00515 [Acidobacteriaceae bacterium]
MSKTSLLLALLIPWSGAFAQTAQSASAAFALNAPTTLPIVFTNSISAKSSHPGDAVLAKTTQVVRLGEGVAIPAGTRITGHVVAADPFAYDHTPYAHQKNSVLSIHFDSIQIGQHAVPLSVTVRAMADPVTSAEARTPLSYDLDPSGTMTQIGGDKLVRGQAEVVNADEDVVEYSKHDGVYAHLIANGSCDGGSTEVSVGIYSASACGLYGFAQTSAAEMGTASHPSTLTLISTHLSPKVWKNSTALLEVLPGQQNVASR